MYRGGHIVPYTLLFFTKQVYNTNVSHLSPGGGGQWRLPPDQKLPNTRVSKQSVAQFSQFLVMERDRPNENQLKIERQKHKPKKTLDPKEEEIKDVSCVS